LRAATSLQFLDVTLPKVSQLALHRWQAIVVFPLEQNRDANTKTNCHGTREKLRGTFLLCTHFRICDGYELRSAEHKLRLDTGVERE
jgi:hypothetical protein